MVLLMREFSCAWYASQMWGMLLRCRVCYLDVGYATRMWGVLLGCGVCYSDVGCASWMWGIPLGCGIWAWYKFHLIDQLVQFACGRD